MKRGREKKKEKKKGERKKKMTDSLDSRGSGLSHFEGDFLKIWRIGYLVLEEGKKEDKKGGYP